MVELATKPNPRQPGWLAPSDAETGVNPFHWQVAQRQRAWRPPTDVYVSDEAVIVRVEIAGMRTGDFSISLENRTLTIRGLRPDQPEHGAYHQMEIRFGEFRTDIGLHCAVDAENIEAQYIDGFLRVTLPIAQPHSVEIQE